MSENTKTTKTFIGRINGVTYDTPEAFNEAFERLKNGTSKVCPKCGKPECDCELLTAVEYIERPAIYATDIDYIVPQHTEFKTELLPEQWDDVNNKLERRMAYFVQQMRSMRSFSKDELHQIVEKCEVNANILYACNKILKQIIEFLKLRKYYTEILQIEFNCVGEIIGFYHAMADNAKDEIERLENCEAEKVEQKEQDEQEEQYLDKIQDLLHKLPQEQLADIITGLIAKYNESTNK